MARKKKNQATQQEGGLRPASTTVSREASRLQSIGIKLADDDIKVQAETIRIARRIEKSGRRVVGLWPANERVAVPPLAVHLGSALVQLTSSTVAYVDANVRYPATLGLAEAAKAFEEDESIFATFWLYDSLALIVPSKVGEAGAGVPQLRYVIASSQELFSFMLVDLTGFEALGDHLNVVDLLDGVIIVGLAGNTREKELLRIKLQIEPQQQLGCVLVG